MECLFNTKNHDKYFFFCLFSMPFIEFSILDKTAVSLPVCSFFLATECQSGPYGIPSLLSLDCKPGQKGGEWWRGRRGKPIRKSKQIKALGQRRHCASFSLLRVFCFSSPLQGLAFFLFRS